MLLSRLVLIACLPALFDASPIGALKLDNITFDKMVAAPGFNLLVLFDNDGHREGATQVFEEVAKNAGIVRNLLVGDVIVKDYGDEQNDDLRERFGLHSEDFPAYILFKGSADNSVRFKGLPDPATKRPATWDDDEDGEWEAPMLEEASFENLAIWLRQHGVKMPSGGTIYELNELADLFMRAFMKNSKDDTILKAATKLAEEDYKADIKAKVYIKIMDKVQSKGVEYVATELTRVKKLLAGSVTPEKAMELTDKVNILQAFVSTEI